MSMLDTIEVLKYKLVVGRGRMVQKLAGLPRVFFIKTSSKRGYRTCTTVTGTLVGLLELGDAENMLKYSLIVF
jgi:hypothetical protein